MSGGAGTWRWEVARWMAVGVLMLAAGLKYDLLVSAEGREGWGWGLMLVELEVGVAAWLATGVCRRGAGVVGITLFVVFAGVSLWKGFGGAESCGCFGRVGVSPWVTAVLDVAMVGLLVGGWTSLRPVTDRNVGAPEETASTRADYTGGRGLTPLLLSVGLLGAGVWMGWRVGTYLPGRLGAEGVVVGDGRRVELLPEEWSGKRFPLGPYIEGDWDWKHRKWTAMLVMHTCPHCLAAMADLVDAGKKPDVDREKLGRVMVIEVPPYGELPEGIEKAVKVVKLRADREWVVRVPVVVRLEEGVVRWAGRGYVEMDGE